MHSKDIIKALVLNGGTATVNGQTKYMSLISMVVASDIPLSRTDSFIAMGSAMISEELDSLPKYKCPYKMSNVMEIGYVSTLSPDDLESYE